VRNLAIKKKPVAESKMDCLRKSPMSSIALAGLSACTRLLGSTPLGGSKLLIQIQEFLLPIFYHQSTVRVGEFEINVHSPHEFIAKKLILSGCYEKHLIELLLTLIKPGDTVVDVGANIGLHTLHLSRAVGPNGRVLAFEPDPSNFALLAENLHNNECVNVTAFPWALGNSDDSTILYTYEKNKGYQSFADLTGSGKPIRVDVRRGSDVFGDHRPSLIKIDVEGAEPLVFQGLGYKPENLVFEFVPHQLRALGNDPTRFLTRLVSEGYSLFRLAGSRLISVQPAQMTQLADTTRIDYNLLAKKK
jgi:FkbM family methyltransferase